MHFAFFAEPHGMGVEMAIDKNSSDIIGKDIIFGKSFRGYNVEEVDSYVEYTQNDIEALQREIYQLQKKLDAAYDEIEDYKRVEKVKKDLYAEAKKEADRIVKDAKTRAAHVIMRTSSQCNRIVADMVSQVEEQKNIYDATKKEILRFRTELFGQYSSHIRKINAFVEAAGVFESDALADDDINGVISAIHGNKDDGEIGFDYEIGDDVQTEVEKIKNEAEETADRIYAERKRKDYESGILNISRNDGDGQIAEEDAENSDGETLFNEADDAEEHGETYVQNDNIGEEASESDLSGEKVHEKSAEGEQAPNSASQQDGAVKEKTSNESFRERSGDFFFAPTEKKSNGAEIKTEKNIESPTVSSEPKSNEVGEARDEEISFKKALEELEAVVGSAEKATKDLDIFNTGKNASRNDGSNVLTTSEDFNSLEQNIAELGRKLESEDGHGAANGYGFDVSSAVKDGSEVAPDNDGFFDGTDDVDDGDEIYDMTGKSHRDDDDEFYHEDDDEFYHEDDDEYVTRALDGRPTSSSYASLEIQRETQTETKPKRWAVKKSMSLTDEFDIVEADDEDA